nr:gustatory receptor 2 sugar taste 43a [Monochamus saltuarius]
MSVMISRKIYESFSTIFHVSRIIGICPFLVLGNTNGFNLVWSRKMLVCSYLSISVLVCFSIYGLAQNYKIKQVYNIRLRTVAGLVCTLCENISLLFSCMLATILTPFCRRHFGKYLQCLHQTDLLLIPKIRKQDKTCSRVTIMALTITIIILAIDVTMWTNIITKNTPLTLYLLHTLPFYLTYIYQMIVELHFWMLVHLVLVRLVDLNQELLELLQEVETCESLLKSNEYMSRKLVKVVSHFDGLKSADMITSGNITRKVKNIINVHHLLVKAVAATNNYFGINVLVLLIGCLMHLLVTPYVLYLQIKETKNPIFVASQLMWLICHISKLMFIIEPCQKCKTQVQCIVSTACKLLRFEICKESKTQLQALLVQIDRCRIQFTACNLVVMDRTLLSTVTGTVTTYLVILFQFK